MDEPRPERAIGVLRQLMIEDCEASCRELRVEFQPVALPGKSTIYGLLSVGRRDRPRHRDDAGVVVLRSVVAAVTMSALSAESTSARLCGGA